MKPTLFEMFDEACTKPSDNNEHCPRFHELVRECPHVTEFGVMIGRSTVSFLSARPKKLISYDIVKQDIVNHIEDLARGEGLDFEFVLGDSRTAAIEETDLLYIDTEHVYDQLRTELFEHGDKVRKYIVLHDTTSFPNMWPAVEEFLALGTFHIKEKYANNNGLTVLQRKKDTPFLSVLVNSWNGLSLLKTYLRSFKDHTPEEVELCIALDGCEDGSVEYVRDLGYKLAWNPHRGVSGSLNKAEELATGEYYFWSSNDYVFSEGWYQKLKKYMHPYNYISIDLIQPQEVSCPPGGYFGTTPEEFDYEGFLACAKERPNILKDKLGYAFGNGVFHSDRWRAVGGFDTKYDPYGTMDIDFLYSVCKSDPNMVFFCPHDISVYHFVRATIRDKVHIAIEGRPEMFERKHGVGTGDAYRIIEEDSLGKRDLLAERGTPIT
jgi:hypothetical protein